ncbi:hypothetical protein GGS21DRAFT_427551 [Xylaria nigripes]|nr:hypothetical protein GGS21DRAFT_427551 [Xylaria nigripes]
MKGFLAIIACQITAAAAFTMGAWRVPTEDDDLQFLDVPINACGGRFFINQKSCIYCPKDASGLDCTNFQGPGTELGLDSVSTTMGLIVNVPGGQQVYIGPDGALSFTAAHSMSMPSGSNVFGFSLQEAGSLGHPIYLYIEGKSWYLCPTSGGSPTERVYQVFAFADVPDNDECVNTDIRTYDYQGGKVWEYV